MENSRADRDAKAPNLVERVKQEIEAALHREKTHHKETHGRSDDIDESTPIDRVKGPNLLERAKEEIEAVVGTIFEKKGHAHEHDGHKPGTV